MHKYYIHIVTNIEVVILIRAKLLYCRARSRSSHEKVRWVEDCLAPQGNSRFPRKYVEEALPCSLKTCFPKALERNTETSVNNKATFTLGHFGRNRHDP